ncbi:MAG TPA: sensor histidine kinase KdpD [Ktedonobacterales bacterium]|nr:sensor histidine kinase KdpD [Ktedonobacterales bacterium]
MSTDERPPDSARPSADELLDRYQLRDMPGATDGATAAATAEPYAAGQAHRGRLRIYLGMAAGVGKTYAMLNEGQRRATRGTDVVIGYVETHNRPLTAAQIGDLEIIPRRPVTYRGVTLEEMDLDALLQRHPHVALVDELAHTNAPGSRNAKRYQDVEELLAAGITVISTLNIQHLEGLNDLVEAITGARQRETVPDRVLDEADEVELVDIAPEALQSRLRHGNVYPPERAERALANYFSQGNLTALRDLALRRVAEKTETQLEMLMEQQAERDKGVARTTPAELVMVAFDKQPNARWLLRSGWRLARGLKAQLLAVAVVPPGHLATCGQDTGLAEARRLAEDLGAETLCIEGADVAAALASLATGRRATHIVIGQPVPRRWWQELLRPSVVQRLLRAPLCADIHIVRLRDEQG